MATVLRVVTAESSVSVQAEQAGSARMAALVDAIAAGSEGALSQLYELTLARVYGLALSMLENPADAEEVTEDVYLKAWHQASSFDAQRGPVLAWLLTMCRSKALDLLRARRRRLRLQDSVSEQPQQTSEAWNGLLIDDSLLGREIAKLPLLQRQVLVLSYFRGYSHQEIANALDMKLGTVKTHIRRTVDALREVLQP